MDILNFISWIAGKKRVVTSVPDDALIPVGIRTPQRDDKYTTVAIKKSNLISAPYKVYTALLTQSGADAPVATVLEDTLNAELTWYYNSTGIYYAESYGTWKTNKTGIFVGPLQNESVGAYTQTSIDSEDQLFLVVLKSDDTTSDDVLNKTIVEIRVYK